MTEPAAIPSDPRLDRQLALLERLAEVGLEIAVAIERQVQSGQPFDGQAAAMAYARTARAVRLTVMLQSRLIGDAQAQGEVQARKAASHETYEALLREEQQASEKDRVVRIVARVARDGRRGEAAVERLLDEAAERLDDDDIYGDLLARPLSEVVADICRDLGLDPDWARLAEEAWAIDEIMSGEVGEPLAGLSHAEARPPAPAKGGLGEAVERALHRDTG